MRQMNIIEEKQVIDLKPGTLFQCKFNQCLCVTRYIGRDRTRGYYWTKMFFHDPNCYRHKDQWGRSLWIPHTDIVLIIDTNDLSRELISIDPKWEKFHCSYDPPYIEDEKDYHLGCYRYLWRGKDNQWYSSLYGVYLDSDKDPEWYEWEFGPFEKKEDADSAAREKYKGEPFYDMKV